MAKRFVDPKKGRELAFRTVPEDQLEVIRHQRKPRPAHIKNLTGSIERIGFVVPLVVIEEKSGGKTSYVIIDGQHRFEAARSVGVTEFPVIVVPSDLSTRMMSLNVETALNIREKAAVSLSIFRSFLDEAPDVPEDDGEIVDSIEHAHFITLGLAYAKTARLAGSSFEPILKRCDSFLSKPLSEGMSIREQRASSVLEAHELVKSIGEKIREMGAWHSFITQQILSYANPFKRKRGAVDFDEALSGLIERLKKLEDNPGRVLREPIGE